MPTQNRTHYGSHIRHRHLTPSLSWTLNFQQKLLQKESTVRAGEGFQLKLSQNNFPARSKLSGTGGRSHVNSPYLWLVPNLLLHLISISQILMSYNFHGSCELPESGSIGLGWSLRFCISKLPGDANSAGPWTTLSIARNQILSLMETKTVIVKDYVPCPTSAKVSVVVVNFGEPMTLW